MDGISEPNMNYEVMEAQTSDERLVTAADDVHPGCHLGPFQGARAVRGRNMDSLQKLETDVHAALHWSSLKGMLLSIFDPQFKCIMRRKYLGKKRQQTSK